MAVTANRPRRNHLELARRVLDRARSMGMRRGDHLPEQRFASYCNVSRTPIRSAFKILKNNNILNWEEEFGYTLAIDPREPLNNEIGLSDTAEDALADRILSDRAARRIDKIVSISDLMRRYDVSRHSVLNALKVLQGNQLVVQTPGQAWMIRPVLDNSDAVESSIEFRLAIEPRALEEGFALDRQRADYLRREMTRFVTSDLDSRRRGTFARLDVAFHCMVAEGASNRFIQDALLSHHKLRQLPGATQSLTVFRMRQSMQEHLDILDQLETGRFAVAADMMRVHLQMSRVQRPRAIHRTASVATNSERGAE